jgi:hypothetical protein
MANLVSRLRIAAQFAAGSHGNSETKGYWYAPREVLTHATRASTKMIP